MFKFLILLQILIQIIYVNGHGFIYDPVGRGSAWRKSFKTPEDFDDEGLFCGGFNSHWELNQGKCGVCGDAYEDKNRPHEVGGKFVTKPPTIVRQYEQGDLIDVVVNLTANHGGFFIFQLCPVNNPDKEATEDCLNANSLEVVKNKIFSPPKSPVRDSPPSRSRSPPISENLPNENDVENELNNIYDNYEFDRSREDTSGESQERDIDRSDKTIDNRVDVQFAIDQNRNNPFNPVNLNDHTYDKYKYPVPFESPKSYSVKVKLPNEINCERCVFRWIYVTGNTWGQCNGSQTEGRQGCGRQEEFRNCADIKIH